MHTNCPGGTQSFLNSRYDPSVTSISCLSLTRQIFLQDETKRSLCTLGYNPQRAMAQSATRSIGRAGETRSKHKRCFAAVPLHPPPATALKPGPSALASNLISEMIQVVLWPSSNYVMSLDRRGRPKFPNKLICKHYPVLLRRALELDRYHQSYELRGRGLTRHSNETRVTARCQVTI